MPVQRRIMVIEDDPHIAHVLDVNLRGEGFAVSVAQDGEAGLAQLARDRHDLLILDLMLPGIDGLSVCREVRKLADYLPIIIVSAKSAEAHRVLGLELGADDYLTKPFSLPELIARVRAVLRRMDAAGERAAQRAGVVQRGDLVIDPVSREVRINEASIPLTTREFDLLLFFARHPGRAFNRKELLDQVWGYSHDGYEHTVNSHINRLRTKIEVDPAHPTRIITVWGVGYKFSDPGECR
jgi:two-component system, OmpR family, response regulator